MLCFSRFQHTGHTLTRSKKVRNKEKYEQMHSRNTRSGWDSNFEPLDKKPTLT